MKNTLIPIIVLALIAFISSAHCQSLESQTDSTPTESSQQITFKQLPANFGKDFVGLFSIDNLWPLAIGGAAAGVSTVWDDSVHTHFAAQDTNRPLGKVGEVMGDPVVLVPALGTVVILGATVGNERFHRFSYALLEGILLDSALVTGLKYAAGRERPDSTNHLSFPSGHASDYFMIATTVDHYYGHGPGFLMYGVATYVGASRLVRDKHWLSDVVAGATLGYIVGRTVSRMTGLPAPKKVEWMPIMNPVQKQFGVHLTIHLS